MRRAWLAFALASGTTLGSSSAGATVRSFVYSHESSVLAPGQSELAPWTTFRVGRSRYYSALDGRLELAHGISRRLELGLYWNFGRETRDVVADALTQQLVRISSSELRSASARLKYQLSDAAADLLGSALYLEATLGPRQSALEARVMIDRRVSQWLLAANASAELQLEPTRGEDGSELEAALVLEPAVAAAYLLPYGVSLGLELRAPLGVAGPPSSATLFGGPVLRWADDSLWAALGVQPQLAAFSGQSAGSRLDLSRHERLELRLLAGFAL